MRRAGWLCLALAGMSPGAIAAQETVLPAQVVPSADTLRSSVVTLDRKRLFEESLSGKATLQRFEAASADLIAENQKLEAALEAEERQLTNLRKTVSADEFLVIAQEFDTRVEELRQAQAAKGRALTRSRDLDQQRFFEAAVPILAKLMGDVGAVAIIDRSAVILSFDRIDITAQAIARLDEVLGDTPAVLPEPEAESGPATNSGPESGTESGTESGPEPLTPPQP